MKNAKLLPLPLDGKTCSKGSPVFDQQNMAFFKPAGNWPRAQHPKPNPGDRFQAISKDIWCPSGRCRCHQRRNGPGGSTRKASSPKPPQCPQHSTTQFWNLPPRKCLGGAQRHCECSPLHMIRNSPCDQCTTTRETAIWCVVEIWNLNLPSRQVFSGFIGSAWKTRLPKIGLKGMELSSSSRRYLVFRRG